MNEVSIIINGVRYDAVCVNKDLSHPCCCNLCAIGSYCIQGDTCLCYTFDRMNIFTVEMLVRGLANAVNEYNEEIKKKESR